MPGSSGACCATGCSELGTGVAARPAGQCPHPHGTQPHGTPVRSAEQVRWWYLGSATAKITMHIHKDGTGLRTSLEIKSRSGSGSAQPAETHQQVVRQGLECKCSSGARGEGWEAVRLLAALLAQPSHSTLVPGPRVAVPCQCWLWGRAASCWGGGGACRAWWYPQGQALDAENGAMNSWCNYMSMLFSWAPSFPWPFLFIPTSLFNFCCPQPRYCKLGCQTLNQVPEVLQVKKTHPDPTIINLPKPFKSPQTAILVTEITGEKTVGNMGTS